MPPADDLFPFLIGAIMMMIPIVAILTRHQQKMARIMRGMPEEEHPNVKIAAAALGHHPNPHQVDQLRSEVHELRQLMAQQAIAIDNLAASQAELTRAIREKGEIQQRLGQ